ncbi:unnamed protein product, partial [Porites evermanni]
VSADARPRGGSWLGKITYHFKGLLSATKEMACESEWLPLKNFLSCDTSGPYSFCNGYDCPEFDEKKLNVSGKIVEDYTLRCYYKPYKWVSTSYNERRTDKSEAFMRLFRYISGSNKEEMKIKMTVPVTMQMQPDEASDSFCKENYTMSFFIPFKHQIDAPAATEENVRLEEVEPFCAYVKVYGGWSSKWKVERNYKALVAALKRDGFGDDFRTDVIYSAGYDDPMTKFNRHNEVWLVSKNQSPAVRNRLEFFSVKSMSTVFTVILILRCPLVINYYPRFCGDYDCPDFYEKKLNVSSKDYTLRCYPKPYKWVSTTFNGRRSRSKQTEAFWRLFRYIQGENEKKMKINMTVPVVMRMELDDTSDSFCKENATMSFFIPFKHQIDAPAPTEENVRLEEVEPFCAYVKVYGGWSSKWKVERNYKALVAALQRDGFGDDFRNDVIYSAGYDDPMKMFNRHNEVWLISKNQSPKGNNL